MPREKSTRKLRVARHQRVRRKVSGSEERPRLSIFRSSRHIYAQIINDVIGHTIAYASSLEPEIKSSLGQAAKTSLSQMVGAAIASRALSTGTNKVVFDRGGYLYHGRVKALADAAREGGLVF
jgi:large subunit ribosomal protein L18